MTRRLAATALALMLTAGTLAVLSAAPAAAAVPCGDTAQIARVPRYQGNGNWRAEMSCIGKRSGRAGDVNIGRQNLTGRVCLVQMYGGYPLYTLACGYGYSATTYVPGGQRIATQVWLTNGTTRYSGSTTT